MNFRGKRLAAVAFAVVMSVSIAACSSSASPTPNAVAATPTPAAPGAAATPANMILISNFAFSPATMTVAVGTKVTWMNQDSATHTVVSDDGKTFQSGGIAQGQTYSFTFTTAGTFAYHCSVHPQMKATITVQ
jgi:plastocyanin